MANSRAIDAAGEELKTGALADTIPHSANNAPKYARKPTSTANIRTEPAADCDHRQKPGEECGGQAGDSCQPPLWRVEQREKEEWEKKKQRRGTDAGRYPKQDGSCENKISSSAVDTPA